jgi:hypothetical protein
VLDYIFCNLYIHINSHVLFKNPTLIYPIVVYCFSITSTSCLAIYPLFIYIYITYKHIVVEKLFFLSKLTVEINVVAIFWCNYNDHT